jgi:hypothetical protein
MNPTHFANADRYTPLYMNTIKLLIFFFLMYLCLPTYSQSIQNKEFEQTRGKWPVPIKKVKRVLDQNTDPHPSAPGVTFVADSGYSVKAIYDGTVLGVDSIAGGGYYFSAKFGDYLIIYINLTKPVFRKGDNIKKGDIIGRINKADDETEYVLDLMLLKKSKYIPILNWFNLKSGV